MLWWTLRQLKEQLVSEDSGTREQAARKLGEIKDSRAVKPLIAALKDSSSYVRHAATKALEKIGDERAVEPLIAALKDSDSGVRWAATGALGKIGDERAVEPLIAALKDGKREVRKAAAMALGKIGDTRAIEPLIAELKSSVTTIRVEAAAVLQLLGWKPKDDKERPLFDFAHALLAVKRGEWEKAVNSGMAIVEPLVAALKWRNSGMRHDAAWALGEVGDARAVEPLVVALKDDYYPATTSIVEALKKIGDAQPDKSLTPFLKENNLGAAAVKPLLAFLGQRKPLSEDVSYTAWILGEIGDTRAVEPLVGKLKYSDYQYMDFNVWNTIAEALGKIGDPRAVDILITGFHHSEAQAAAADALLKIGAPAVASLVTALKGLGSNAVKVLVKMGDVAVGPLVAALNCDNEGRRLQAVEALQLLGWKPKDATVIGPLIAALKGNNNAVQQDERQSSCLAGNQDAPSKDSNYAVQVEAAWALRKIGASCAVEPLIAALKDNNRHVREAVAEALGEIGDIRAFEPLVAVLNDSNDEARGEAAKSLGKIDKARAVEPLVAVLKDGNAPWQVTEALVKIGNAAVTPLVVFLQGANENARLDAAMVLGKIGDAHAVEPLIAALKSRDAHSGLRWSAARVLAKVGAAAVEPLMTALKDSDERIRKIAAWALGEIKDARAVETLITALKDSNDEVRGGAAKALGEIKDARAVQPLVDLTRDRLVAEVAVGALEKILCGNATSVKTESLQAAANLTSRSQTLFGHSDCSDNKWEIGKKDLDCWQVRQLARQELIRRGIQA